MNPNPNPNHWDPDYLGTFAPFVDSNRSPRYALSLLSSLEERKLVSIPKSLQLADICCGTGLFGQAITGRLRQQGKEVSTTFVDLSQDSLARIELGANDRTIAANVTNMQKVEPGGFDLVVCRYGFNNLSQAQWILAINETLRILKPGGVFLLQDHFVPGTHFSALVNEAEQLLAEMEGKPVIPFIYSTEAFNGLLDAHPVVANRHKCGFGLQVNIWDRIRTKHASLPDFEKAQQNVLDFYRRTCFEKWKLLIVDPEEYIHVYNITYAIQKRK